MNPEKRLNEIVCKIETTGDITHAMELVSLSPEGANWRTLLTGETLLHLAVQRNDLPLVESLIRMGANSNAVSDYGHTPMHYAAKNFESKDIVSLLLAAGAQSDALDEKQESPLYVAARRENVAFINQLLHADCQMDVRAACRLGWSDVVAALFESDRVIHVDLNILLDDAIKSHSLTLVQMLLNKGADPNGAGQRPPLWSALRSGTPQPAILQALLERGASPDVKDRRGDSLLSVAARLAGTAGQCQSDYRQIADLLARFV